MRRRRDHRERVVTGCHALEHLVRLEVAQVGVVELRPRARRRHRRTEPPAQGVRGDRRLLAVVLAPVDEHAALAEGLAHARHDELGVVGLEGLRELVRDLRYLVGRLAPVQRRVEVDALAPARDRHRLEPHARDEVAHEPGDLRAVGQPHPLARVEVEDHAVGIPRLAARIESPLRHVELERGELREPHERGAVPGDRVRLRTVGVTDDGGADPVGRVLEVLLEERRLRGIRSADAVHPALARDRTAGDERHHDRGDLRVVGDHLALGHARLGIHDLVEVRQPHLGGRRPRRADARPRPCPHHARPAR